MTYGHAVLLAALCFHCRRQGAHFYDGAGNLCCGECALKHED